MMRKKYTRAETISKIEEAVKEMSTFYKAECVNYTGTTYKADGDEYYTEIISEYLLENYNLFDHIEKIRRENYKIATHTGTTPCKDSNRKEERLALAMIQEKELQPIGETIDYQIPLKSKRKDVAGKIDLMTFDRATGILRLIELKAPESPDTMLHCILEIYTYYKTVDIDTLLRSFDLDGKCKEIRICPLFFKGSRQNREYETLDVRGNLVNLMNKISCEDVKVELLRFPVEKIPDYKNGTSEKWKVNILEY